MSEPRGGNFEERGVCCRCYCNNDKDDDEDYTEDDDEDDAGDDDEDDAEDDDEVDKKDASTAT